MEIVTFQDLSLLMISIIALASFFGGVLGYIVQQWKNKR